MITADAENVPCFLEDKHSPFSQCFPTFSRLLLVSAANMQFKFMFKVTQASGVFVLDFIEETRAMIGQVE